jgi:hypothetical protein
MLSHQSSSSKLESVTMAPLLQNGHSHSNLTICPLQFSLHSSFGKKQRVAPNLSNPLFFYKISGAPWVIRTPDLLVRSQTLYPAELRAHCQFFMLAQRRQALKIITSTQIFLRTFSKRNNLYIFSRRDNFYIARTPRRSRPAFGCASNR